MSDWRRFLVAIAVVGAPAAVWFGCSSSYTSGTIGTLGAACFANNTCDTGLACVSSKCVANADASGADGAFGADSGNNGDMDGGGSLTDSGSGAGDCGVPTLQQAGAGPFCPFQQFSDGGPEFSSCALGEHCCDYRGISPSPASTCNAGGVVCASQADYVTLDWACDIAGNCPANNVCCMYGKDSGTTNVVADNACASGALLRALNVGGAHCVVACAAGEIKLCGSSADCLNGMTCTAFSTNAKTLGFCR